MNQTRKASVFSVLLLFLAATCFSQIPEDTIGRLSIDVDVVLIPVTVTNERGQYVSGLGPEHFQVFEDRVEQTLSYVSNEDAPMSLGIILDSSGSMNPVMSMARRNGGACMDLSSRQDEYFLIVFSDQLKVNTNFTSDIQSLRTELLTVQSKGSTALYDAVYAGVAKVREGNHPRKALVIVSDGYDNHSRYSSRNLREAVRESDVQLYLIGNEGDGSLRQLAESTGGRSLSPRSRTYELGNICNEIVRSLKNQYVIAYKSTNEAKDGKWRDVRVKLNAPNNMKLNIRHKTGYYAPGTPD